MSSPTRSQLDKSIGIVGGGVAGLYTAQLLTDRGYRDVQVYESSDRIGGKVKSVTVDGHHFELGAVSIPSKFPLFRKMLRSRHVKTRRLHDGAYYVDPEGGSQTIHEYLKQRHGIKKLAVEAARVHRIAKNYRDFQGQKVLGRIPPELQCSTAEFFERESTTSVGEPMQYLATCTGYGFPDQLPALYMVRLLDVVLGIGSLQMLHDVFRMPTSGLDTPVGRFIDVWDSIADAVNVNLGHEVTSIERSDFGVKLQFATGAAAVHDHVIMAADATRYTAIMDLDAAEATVFDGLQSNVYAIGLYHMNSPTRFGSYYLTDNLQSDRANHLTTILHNTQSDFYVTYQLCRRDASLEEINRLCREDLQGVGATSINLVEQVVWPNYFPHYSGEALAEDPYVKLQWLQGRGGCYFAGGIHGFETVESIMQNANAIVEASF